MSGIIDLTCDNDVTPSESDMKMLSNKIIDKCHRASTINSHPTDQNNGINFSSSSDHSLLLMVCPLCNLTFTSIWNKGERENHVQKCLESIQL